MIVGAPWNLDWRDSNLQAVTQGHWLVYGEDNAFLSLSSASDWKAHAGLVAGDPVIRGYYDGVQQHVMQTSDMGSELPWPLHGQQGIMPDVALIELAEEAGFDVGGHLSQAITPRMVFASPPSYSEQTDPIPAIGYP